MSKPAKYQARALRLLLERCALKTMSVSFSDAQIKRLVDAAAQGSMANRDKVHSDVIREVAKIYLTTWVLPLIALLIEDDKYVLERLTR